MGKDASRPNAKYELRIEAHIRVTATANSAVEETDPLMSCRIASPSAVSSAKLDETASSQVDVCRSGRRVKATSPTTKNGSGPTSHQDSEDNEPV